MQPILVGIIASVLYAALNMAMNLYMKWLFTPWGGNFALPWTMLAVQQAEALVALQLWFLYADPGRWGWGLASSSLGLLDGVQVMILTCLFCLNVGLNSLALVRMSVTLNQTVRAFLPIGVLLLATHLERRPYPKWSYLTASMLIAGIALACLHSPDFEMYGFSLCIGSTFLASLACSLNGRLLHIGPFSGQDTNMIARLVMMQAVPAILIFSVLAAFTEWDALSEIIADPGPGGVLRCLALVLFSGVLALAANLGRCGLVSITSALMETLSGNMKVAALCILDHRLFGTTLRNYNYAGVGLAFAGFSLHVFLQHRTVAATALGDEDCDNRKREIGKADLLNVASVAPRSESWGSSGDDSAAPRSLSMPVSLFDMFPETGLIAEALSMPSCCSVNRSHLSVAEQSSSSPVPIRRSPMSWHAGQDEDVILTDISSRDSCAEQAESFRLQDTTPLLEEGRRVDSAPCYRHS